MLLGRIRCQADKVSGTDFGHIDARSRFRFLTPFSFPPRRVDHKIRATAGPAEHRSHVDFTHVTPHQGKVKGTVGRSAAAKEGTWIGTGHEISGTPHLTLRSRVWCPWYSRRDTRSAMVWPWPNTVTWAVSGDSNSDPLLTVLIPTPVMPSCYRLLTPSSGSFLIFTSVSRWVCSGSTFVNLDRINPLLRFSRSR